jgi:hypothetical protein
MEAFDQRRPLMRLIRPRRGVVGRRERPRLANRRAGTVVVLALVLSLALAACGLVSEGTARLSGGGQPSASLQPPVALKTTPTPQPTATRQPAAPDCLSNQLATQFILGGVGTGNMFATILVRNTSPTACSMEGTQDVYGVDTQGVRVTVAQTNPPAPLARVVLPPRTPATSPGASPTPSAYLMILLVGAYRDDFTDASTNGLCTATHEVTPARFVVTIDSVMLQVANYQTVSGWAGSHSIYGCHGAIGVGGAFLSS